MSVMQTEMNTSDDLRMEWDPFSDNQVDGLFFPGGGRAELVEQVLHLLRYGPALSLLVGPSGAGKRNLVAHLLSQMDRDLFDVAVVNADVMLSFPQLLEQLDEPWRVLRPFTLDSYLEMVPAVAAAADEESKTLVCILVGAQQLSDELLGHLLAMLGASAGLPVKCLLLVDAAELEAVPSMQGLLEGLPDSAVLYLDPLDLAQTQEYLQYRLHTAGLGQIRFNEEQVQRIFDSSGGNIARINEVARELLLEALPAPKSSQEKRPLPWMHIGALGVAAALLLALFLNQSDEDQPAAVPETAVVVLDNPVQPMTEPATEQLPFAEVARVAAESAAPTSTVDIGTPGTATAEPAPSASVNAEVSPVTTVVVDSNNAAAAENVTKAPVSPNETPAPLSSEKVVEAAPAPKPVQSKPAPVQPKPVAAPASSARTDWLRNLPADHYVLQLLGAQEEATVKRFLSQYPSLRKVTYYKTWRQGKPWYVVVQGDYASHDAAKAAVGRLPAGVQKQNPWVRKVEVVKREIPSR